jgi:DNA-binding CsgD family transcriptional regulator
MNRQEEMVMIRKEGYTFQQIGDMYGITRQRAQQLLDGRFDELTLGAIRDGRRKWRFYSRAQKDPMTGCWNWHGAWAGEYGSAKMFGQHLAHRISWIFEHGLNSIPEGMCVCHKCDNPRCINPEHLFLGSQKANISDCIEKGRRPQVLDYDKVEEIKQAYGRGKSIIELAYEYGVSYMTAYRAAKDKSSHDINQPARYGEV